MILAKGFKFIKPKARLNLKMQSSIFKRNMGLNSRIKFLFSEDRKARRRMRAEEEQRRIREEERQRIMDELNKNKVNFSKSKGTGKITMGKIAKYDLLIGSLLITLIIYFNSEYFEDPVGESKTLLFNSKEIRKIAADKFVENLIFEHTKLFEESGNLSENLEMVKDNFQKEIENEFDDIKISNIIFLNLETPVFLVLPNLSIVVSRKSMVDMLSSKSLMKTLCQLEISHLALRSQFNNLSFLDNLNLMKVKFMTKWGWNISVEDSHKLKDLFFTSFSNKNLIRSRKLLNEYGNRLSPEQIDGLKDYLENLDKESIVEKGIGNLKNLSIQNRYANFA